MKEMANWTAERIDTLKRLAGESCTASHIASVLGAGVTRSAVCAKAARLGVKLNGGPGGATGARKPRPSEWRMRRGPATPPVVPRPVSIEPVLIDGRRVSLEMLRDGMCKWPIGEVGPDLHFCARESVGSWCPLHQSIVWQPARRGGEAA